MRRRLILAVLVVMVPFGCEGDDKTPLTPPPTGACCTPAGTCTVTAQANCAGTWTQAGLCAPNPCVQSPPAMVQIPAGTFAMGSPVSEGGRSNTETPHQVTFAKSLYVSTCEVTQSEWQAVMGWNDSRFPGGNRPVERVTWYDAVNFCNHRSIGGGYIPVYAITGATHTGNHITRATVTWNQAANGYRLLTEAEWEYACRATSGSAFCNGGITNTLFEQCLPLDPNLDEVGWYCVNASSSTQGVGGKSPNEWGLYDMHGNVWEWCWDREGAYEGSATDPTGPASGLCRVSRGGSWSSSALYCRSARRAFVDASFGYYDLGLRISRTGP